MLPMSLFYRNVNNNLKLFIYSSFSWLFHSLMYFDEKRILRRPVLLYMNRFLWGESHLVGKTRQTWTSSRDLCTCSSWWSTGRGVRCTVSVENSLRSSNRYEFMPNQFQFPNFRYCKKYYRKDKDSLKDVSLRFCCDIWMHLQI